MRRQYAASSSTGSFLAVAISFFATYASTNTKAEGEYRKLTLKSNRPGVEIRTRRGYYGVRQ